MEASPEPRESHDAVSRQLSEVIAVQQEVATAELDPDRVMALIAERTQHLTGATGATVELADGDEMVYRAATGSAAPHVGLRLKMDTSLVGLCHRSGQTLSCEDAENDPRVDLEACRKVGLRSMVVVPLRRAGVAVGVLKVLSSRPHAFGPMAIQTLQLMSGLLGATLGNAAELEARKRAQREVELLNAELELRVADRTRQAERALEAREQFLTAASHELKTPVASLILQAQRIRRLVAELDGAVPAVAELMELLPCVDRQGHRLAALTDVLLDAAHRQGSAGAAREPLDLAALVHQALAGTESLRLGAGCVVQVAAPDAPVWALGNRAGFDRALRAVLVNAFQYASHQPVEISLERSGGRSLVRVRDHGPGITAEHQAHLFERFERGAQSGWGLGLGLWLSRELLEAMDGRVELSSAFGDGTVVTLELPAMP